MVARSANTGRAVCTNVTIFISSLCRKRVQSDTGQKRTCDGRKRDPGHVGEKSQT